MKRQGQISVNSKNMFPIIKKWLYSDKDIFLREIVSNGCDAIKKLDPFFQDGEWPFCIGEFGCGKGDGSHEDERNAWIEQMLKDTKELPMIKYGVWFSANDYKEDTISIQNYYALDISEKNLMQAFRNGFAAMKS